MTVLPIAPANAPDKKKVIGLGIIAKIRIGCLFIKHNFSFIPNNHLSKYCSIIIIIININLVLYFKLYQ